MFGLGLSLIGIRLFDAATQDVGQPYWIQFTMDGSVFLFLAAVCLGTGVIFGLAPALHVSKTDVNEILKEGGRSGSAGMRVRRWSGALVIAELALTLTLLAGAGFMVRNFLTHYRIDLGIDSSQLLTMNLGLPDRKYPSLEQRLAFYQQLQERLQASPRIRAVSVASNAPMQGGFARQLDRGRTAAARRRTAADGDDADRRSALLRDHRPGRAARPRSFTAADGAPGQEAAIINTRFAQMHFPNEDPIGRRITLTHRSQWRPAAGGRHSGVSHGDDHRHHEQRAAA